MDTLIDLFLHFDAHLAPFVQTYGVWVYAALFLIIFAETGLVVAPFLPGDSPPRPARSTCGSWCRC